MSVGVTGGLREKSPILIFGVAGTSFEESDAGEEGVSLFWKILNCMPAFAIFLGVLVSFTTLSYLPRHLHLVYSRLPITSPGSQTR